jgi:hypothetical protein
VSPVPCLITRQSVPHHRESRESSTQRREETASPRIHRLSFTLPPRPRKAHASCSQWSAGPAGGKQSQVRNSHRSQFIFLLHIGDSIVCECCAPCTCLGCRLNANILKLFANANNFIKYVIKLIIKFCMRHKKSFKLCLRQNNSQIKFATIRLWRQKIRKTWYMMTSFY